MKKVKLFERYRNIINATGDNNPESKANAYVLYCLTVAMALVGFIWILNVLDIFVIDSRIITIAFLQSLAVYCVGMTIGMCCDLTKSWMKYALLLVATVMVTMFSTFLTYHAALAVVFPILLACMYSSKRALIYTYGWSVIGIAITVYVGYYHGVCDANMALLTTETLEHYISAENTFTQIQVNTNVVQTLGLYYVFPRCMMLGLFTLVCNNIGAIIRDNLNFASEMKLLAEHDEMTGVFNKSKYMNAIENDYQDEEMVAVVFWDVNNLKTVNDTQGHEQGDKLIRMMASSLACVTDVSESIFRIGGDEFVVIIKDGNEDKALDLLKRWKKMVSRLNAQGDMLVSASYGFACGKGKDLQEIIHQADQMMYENKRKKHESVE